MALPAGAMGQAPEQSDDLPMEEETSVVWNNTLFHTDERGGYESDGGTGAGVGSDFHSDDQSQNARAGEALVANTTGELDMWYEQIGDHSYANFSLTSDEIAAAQVGASSTSVTYERIAENYSASAQLSYDGTTLIDQSAPALAIPTGYQVYDAVTDP